jgi:uncharacterized protein
MLPEQVLTAATQHPYPLLFLTVSGAHLYGFPSQDSDWDLRGVHVLPLPDIVGLTTARETVETNLNDGVELDFVTHDIKKFILLMLKPNGYVLEQLLSPIIVITTPEHDELKELSKACITRHHVHHYIGFANNQWKLFLKESPPRVKPLLYTFRTLLTGIHLMNTGEVLANLVSLNELYPLPYISDLVSQKLEVAEQLTIDPRSNSFFEAEFERLRVVLIQKGEKSSLPQSPTSRPALHDLLIRARLGK